VTHTVAPDRLGVSHASVLRVAVPIMLSNVSEPMIGVVNTAVMGRLPEPFYIGAVAVGALVFSFLFWGFGFLRLSTGGMAAQATGAGDHTTLALVFWRSATLVLAIGLLLVIAGPWLGPFTVRLIGGSADVMREAETYFSYRIWTAPAALLNFAIMGWFIGQGRSTIAFIVQLFLNLSNVLLSVFFVMGLGWATAGVGIAVLVAEYAAAALGLCLALIALARSGLQLSWRAVLAPADFRKLIAANFDIMIRTFCLVFAFGWFVSRGAKAGDLIIAANAVLMNLFEVAAYLIDGFAYASEALVGQAVGARDQSGFRRSIFITTLWALVFAALFSVVIWIFGSQLIALLTVNGDVQRLAVVYLPWAALTPLLGAICFQFDGIFTGALATRDMRNMMVVSLAVYLAAWWVLEPAYGNHGLWGAMCVFLLVRGVTFGLRMPALRRNAFK
jgi:multidrug resistance protein, MATE family